MNPIPDKKSKQTGLGCSFLFMLVVIIAGGAYLLRGYFLGKELTPLEAARAVPSDAYMTSFISTDAQDWAKLTDLGTPDAKAAIKKSFVPVTEALSTSDLNYAEDIQPWIGGLMLAILPSKNASDQPQSLMVVGIKNKLKAQEFSQKFIDRPGQRITETDYQGTKIVKVEAEFPVSFAIYNNYLFIANQPSTLELAIDTIKGEASYADNEFTQADLTQSLGLNQPIVTLYVSDYASLLKMGFEQSEIPMSSAQLQQLDKLKWRCLIQV